MPLTAALHRARRLLQQLGPTLQNLVQYLVEGFTRMWDMRLLRLFSARVLKTFVLKLTHDSERAGGKGMRHGG